jgi:hypothetical protein
VSLTPRGARRLLWLAMVVTIPVPFYLGGLEFSPVVRLLFLSGLVWGVALTEGAGGFQSLFSILAGVQVLLWAGLLFAAAALLARASRHHSGSLRAVVFGTMIVALLGLSLTDSYRTPLSSSRPRSNLFGLFD